MEDVGVLMLWSWSDVWGWAWNVVVLTLERMVTLVVVLFCVLEGRMAWVVERQCLQSGVVSDPENGMLLPQRHFKLQRCVAG